MNNQSKTSMTFLFILTIMVMLMQSLAVKVEAMPLAFTTFLHAPEQMVLALAPHDASSHLLGTARPTLHTTTRVAPRPKTQSVSGAAPVAPAALAFIATAYQAQDTTLNMQALPQVTATTSAPHSASAVHPANNSTTVSQPVTTAATVAHPANSSATAASSADDIVAITCADSSKNPTYGLTAPGYPRSLSRASTVTTVALPAATTVAATTAAPVVNATTATAATATASTATKAAATKAAATKAAATKATAPRRTFTFPVATTKIGRASCRERV